MRKLITGLLPAKRFTRAPFCAAALAATLLTAWSPNTTQAAVPNQLLFTAQFGRAVNLTEVNEHAGLALEDVCTLESGDTCQGGTGESPVPGGFSFPQAVAVGPPPDNYVYVADNGNSRVQVLTASGQFVTTFGWEVNETKSNEAGATQAEKDLCTAASGDVCRNGQGEGEGAVGEIANPQAITVDQRTGNLYVWDNTLQRIDEYTPSGEFVLMMGREVNETEVNASGTEEQRNLCTQQEVESSGVKCKGGEFGAPNGPERDAFQPAEEHGDILAFGGPEHLLYVGEKERVQEIEPDGKFVRQISLANPASGTVAPGGTVKALAVDASGNLYVTYYNSSGEGGSGIRVLNPSGTETREIDPSGNVYTFALDPNGYIAAMAYNPALEGVLLETSSGNKLSGFTSPYRLESVRGLGFGPNDNLYGAESGSAAEIEVYDLSAVAFVSTDAATGISGAAATLTGEIDPNEIPETNAWFQYGTSPGGLDASTPPQSLATGSQFIPTDAPVALTPNQTYYYRLVAEDGNDHAPRPPLTAETRSFETPYVSPVIEGAPIAHFVGPRSAVLEATLNPEHANTTYYFQYGECGPAPKTCAESGYGQSTSTSESAAYGHVGVTQETTGLGPSTAYHARLVLTSERGETTDGPEVSFTTAPSAAAQATTGPPLAVGATTATISGSIDPDGVQTAYIFELGIYAGTGTQYGVLDSAGAGAGTAPIAEALALTGLQPATTYAYRLIARGGGTESVGAPVTFTTEGLPSLLSAPAALPLLATPAIAFPTEPKSTPKPKTLKCAKGKKLRKGKCVKSKPKAKHKPKKKK